MSASVLPTEVLQIIFDNLHVNSFTNCRAVCRRWRDIIDDSPNFWKALCEERFPESFNVTKRQAQLSWRDFYNSLTLWPKLSSAEVKIHPTEIETHRFEILPGGIIACAKYGDDEIVYYDLGTLETLKRQHIGISFKLYRETEQMIVILDEEHYVHVIPKANHKKVLVGQHQLNYKERLRDFIVFETEVYFKDSKYNLCNAYLGVVDNEITVGTKNLGFFDREISAAVRVSHDQINFFVTTGIVSLKDGEFEELCTISSLTMKDINIQLEENGFKWSQPEVFYDLSYYDYPFEALPKNITSYKSPIICSYGNIVLVATTRRVIHIFKTYENEDICSDFFEGGKEYKAKLVMTVDIKNRLMEVNNPVYSCKNSFFHNSGNIRQMEIVESLNGHKIVVLYGFSICIVELVHNSSSKESDKRITRTKAPSRAKKPKI